MFSASINSGSSHRLQIQVVTNSKRNKRRLPNSNNASLNNKGQQSSNNNAPRLGARLRSGKIRCLEWDRGKDLIRIQRPIWTTKKFLFRMVFFTLLYTFRR